MISLQRRSRCPRGLSAGRDDLRLDACTRSIGARDRSRGYVREELPDRCGLGLGRKNEPTEFLYGAANLDLEEQGPAPFLVTFIANVSRPTCVIALP